MCKQLPKSATITYVLNECSDIYGTNQNFFNETFSAPSEIVPKLEYLATVLTLMKFSQDYF